MASLTLAAAFGAVTVLSKETPALYLRQPWHDDPYDVPVSLDFVVLPLLVAIGLLRVQLCRRYKPLPARRLVDLLRVSGAALWVCLVTEVAEWVAVVVNRHRATWTAVTTWQVVVLAMVTVATIAGCVLVRRAAGVLGPLARSGAQPDWLADAVVLALRATWLLGPYRGWALGVVRWTDVQVVARVRAHPVAAAGLVAVVLALPFVIAKIVFEGYPAPLVLLSFVFVAATLFAFVVAVGAYLHVVERRQTPPPAWLFSVVVACTVGAVAFAFHNSLLAEQTVSQLSALYFGAGITAGTATLALQRLWRHRANRLPDDRRRYRTAIGSGAGARCGPGAQGESTHDGTNFTGAARGDLRRLRRG